MTEYLIWSEEHRAWWRPHRRGYMECVTKAGRYTEAQAAAILQDANFGDQLNEMAFPITDEQAALLAKHASPDAPHPLETLEDRARLLADQVNRELATLGPNATDAEFEAVIARIIPEAWSWVEATALGGPRSIVLTRYGEE